MKTPEDISKLLDWETILKQPRCSGGHDDIMTNLFLRETAVCIAHWNEGDYQGTVATAYMFKDDGSVLIISDYYGSCCGCDLYEDAADDEIKKLVHDMVQGGILCETFSSAIQFINKINTSDKPWEYPHQESVNLIPQLTQYTL